MTIGDIKSGARASWHRIQVAMYSAAARNDEVIFEEKSHRYFYRGAELPSVTKLIGKSSRFYAPGSADRGKDVHKLCVLEAQGILDESTVAEEYRGYLTAWRAFRAAFRPEFIAYEVTVVNLEIGYAGRCDLMMNLPGHDGTDALLIYLGKTGAMKVEPVDEIAMFSLMIDARAAMQLYNEKRNAAQREELWQD